MTISDETRRIIELLRHRHPAADGWATFVELREGTGYHSVQGIDFFAVHTWPSKNYHSIAYEIKVSRGDFKKEIENPAKRAFAETLAHECMFAAPLGLLKPDEVPEGWGLIVANAAGLKLVKHGTQRTKVTWPQTFMAAVARRQCDPPPTAPAAVWKVFGREVGETELIAIAEQTLQTSIKSERDKLIREGIEQGKKEAEASYHYQHLIEIRKAIIEVTGIPNYRLSEESIRQWANSMGSLGGGSHEKLKEVHRLLGEILGVKP